MDLMLDIYLWLVDTCNFLFTPVFQLYFSATATAPATTVVYTVQCTYIISWNLNNPHSTVEYDMVIFGKFSAR